MAESGETERQIPRGMRIPAKIEPAVFERLWGLITPSEKEARRKARFRFNRTGAVSIGMQPIYEAARPIIDLSPRRRAALDADLLIVGNPSVHASETNSFHPDVVDRLHPRLTITSNRDPAEFVTRIDERGRLSLVTTTDLGKLGISLEEIEYANEQQLQGFELGIFSAEPHEVVIAMQRHLHRTPQLTVDQAAERMTVRVI